MGGLGGPLRVLLQVSSTVVRLQRCSCGLLDEDSEVLLCTVKFGGGYCRYRVPLSGFRVLVLEHSWVSVLFQINLILTMVSESVLNRFFIVYR